MKIGLIQFVLLVSIAVGAIAVPSGGYYNRQFQSNKNKDSDELSSYHYNPNRGLYNTYDLDPIGGGNLGRSVHSFDLRLLDPIGGGNLGRSLNSDYLRRLDPIGGGNLGRRDYYAGWGGGRSLDRIGGGNLNGRSTFELDPIGGGNVGGRSLESIGGDSASLFDPYSQEAVDYNFDKRIENFIPDSSMVGNANIKLFRDNDFVNRMYPKYANSGDRIMDSFLKLKQKLAKNYKRYSADSLGLQTLGKRAQDSLSLQTFGKRFLEEPEQVLI